MGIWASLFGDKNIVKQGLNMVQDGVDKSFFTAEEKSDYLLKFLKAYEPFKIAQRWMMLLVGIPFITIHVISWLVMAVGTLVIDPVYVEGVLQMSRTDLFYEKSTAANQQTLGSSFLMIVSFYFGGGMLEGTVRALKGKDK